MPMTDTADITRLSHLLDVDHAPIPIDLPPYDRLLVAECITEATLRTHNRDALPWCEKLWQLSWRIVNGATDLTLAEAFSVLSALQMVYTPGATEGLAWYFAAVVIERQPEFRQAVEASW